MTGEPMRVGSAGTDPAPQPHDHEVVRRVRRCGCRRHRPGHARQRRPGLDPDSRGVLRPGRHQARLRCRAVRSHERLVVRDGRERAARDHGRGRRARPEPDALRIAVSTRVRCPARRSTSTGPQRRRATADLLRAAGHTVADADPPFFVGYDVLVTPALAQPPIAAAAWSQRGWLANVWTNARYAPFAAPWNLAGWPAMSVPAGLGPRGLPLAVQLVAPPGGEPPCSARPPRWNGYAPGRGRPNR